MKALNNIELLIQSIKKAPLKGAGVKEAKNQKIKFYKEKKEQVNKLSSDQIINHNWTAEIASAVQDVLKLRVVEKYRKNIKGLSRHLYAPELNELIFISGKTYKAPQCTEIDKAIALLIKQQSLESITKIMKG